MKTEYLILAAGALALVYVLFKRGAGAPIFAEEIQNSALPGQVGYGWRYFTDGTAIGPDGSYYKGGAHVMTPQYDGLSVGGAYGNLR